MSLSRARAMCATSRKHIGVAALSGADRVTRLAHQHGTSRKFVRAQRERARLRSARFRYRNRTNFVVGWAANGSLHDPIPDMLERPHLAACRH
jgi:hypothetical protein